MAKQIEEYVIGDTHFTGDIQNSIDRSINNETRIRITATVTTPAANNAMNTVLEAILGKYGAGHLKVSAALVLKELVTNAMKANLKHFLLSKAENGKNIDYAK